MSCSAAWLLSTSSAICIGSSAGATCSTSRATLSSRTTKSAGPRSATGRAVLVEDADVHRALHAPVRRARGVPRAATSARAERRRAQRRDLRHQVSIGPGFRERQANVEPKTGLKSVSCGKCARRGPRFLTPLRSHVINQRLFLPSRVHLTRPVASPCFQRTSRSPSSSSSRPALRCSRWCSPA